VCSADSTQVVSTYCTSASPVAGTRPVTTPSVIFPVGRTSYAAHLISWVDATQGLFQKQINIYSITVVAISTDFS
jgi:hypothetical protein